ncbi:MAG: TRIC cation channel family protein, partial [Firmicutes bacterium]|nr:TRIC cation channel family protein [Bacillota bacterium]
GGGVMRDVMANQLPLIFVKHIYACASLAGALLTVLLWGTSEKLAVVCGFALTIFVRFIAAHYKLNLPRIKHK